MIRSLAFVLTIWGSVAAADPGQVAAPPALADTGLVDHLLPRFSLKSGVRLTRGDTDPVARFGDAGTPVIEGPAHVWSLEALTPDGARFLDWLRSDIGKRTIAGFAGGQFAPAQSAPQVTATATPIGDTAAGERLSLDLCGRCHVVNYANRMNGLGSTPSFAVLRGLPNWQGRFESFYALNPHGAFTQVEEVTPPFDPMHPSPIAPLELTLDDLDAITAFVAAMAPADLGAPIQAR